MDDGNGNMVTGKIIDRIYEDIGKGEGGAERVKELKERAAMGLGVFQEGEVVEVKGSRFKILSFGKKFMRLELLPWVKQVDEVKL